MRIRQAALLKMSFVAGVFAVIGGCSIGLTGFIDAEDLIARTSPADGATGVSVGAAIVITFLWAADPPSLDLWLEPDTGDVSETWSDNNTVLTITPAAPLQAGTEYVVVIGELVLEDGSDLAAEFSFRFTTAAAAEGNGDGAGNDGDASPLTLGEVRFWGYQIQGLDRAGAVDALVGSLYDMLVLEPTRTDVESKDFDTQRMVARLKETMASDGVHRKLIIAYVDVGEAEDWRWYWTWSKEPEEAQVPEEVDLPDDWPDFIVARDPDGWVGNYPVAYWDPRWKDIIIYGRDYAPSGRRDYASAIDELLVDGFDGIYLDWVEGFENLHVAEAAAAEGLDAAEEMIDFIGEIRAYARERNPGFLVIQQNAAALIDGRPELLEHIDAIAQEGVWYDGVAGDDWDDVEGYFFNEPDLTNEYLGFLDRYLAAGVPVFICEYALAGNADSAYARAQVQGYVPYVTRRSLSRLTDTLPPGLH